MLDTQQNIDLEKPRQVEVKRESQLFAPTQLSTGLHGGNRMRGGITARGDVFHLLEG